MDKIDLNIILNALNWGLLEDLIMRYTRTAIGLLTRQYRSVLRKCWMINVGLFTLGAAMMPTKAEADSADPVSFGNFFNYSYLDTQSWSAGDSFNYNYIDPRGSGGRIYTFETTDSYGFKNDAHNNTIRDELIALGALSATAVEFSNIGGTYKVKYLYNTYDDLSDNDKLFYEFAQKYLNLQSGVRFTENLNTSFGYEDGDGHQEFDARGFSVATDGMAQLNGLNPATSNITRDLMKAIMNASDSSGSGSGGWTTSGDSLLATDKQIQIVDTDNPHGDSVIFQVNPNDSNPYVNIYNANFKVLFKNDISGNDKYGTQTYRYSNGNAAYFEVVNRKADNTRLNIHLGSLLDNGNASVPYFYMAEGDNKGVIIRSDLGLFLGDSLAPGNTSASNVWNTSSSYLTKTGFKVNGSTAVSGIDTAVPTTSPAAGTEKLITSRAVYDRLSSAKFSETTPHVIGDTTPWFNISDANGTQASLHIRNLQSAKVYTGHVDTNSITIASNEAEDSTVYFGVSNAGVITVGGNISANGQTVTPTNLGYLSGATSNIQTQLNSKVNNTALNDYYTKLDFAGESVMNHSHRSFGASPNVKRSSALFTPRERGAGGGNTSAANTPALKNIIIGRSLDQTSRFGGMTLLLCASHATPSAANDNDLMPTSRALMRVYAREVAPQFVSPSANDNVTNKQDSTMNNTANTLDATTDKVPTILPSLMGTSLISGRSLNDVIDKFLQMTGLSKAGNDNLTTFKQAI